MPLTYTGAPDIVDDLIQVYRGSVPADIAADDRDLDEAWALAEMMAVVEGQSSSWTREARLSTSDGIWTDQHARDRGLSRQEGETDESLIARLRTSPSAITEDALQDAVDAIASPSYLVAVPVTHGAFCTIDAWCSMDSRVTPTATRGTIAIIPASANARTSVLDALRVKMPVGHFYIVEEY